MVFYKHLVSKPWCFFNLFSLWPIITCLVFSEAGDIPCCLHGSAIDGKVGGWVDSKVTCWFISGWCLESLHVFCSAREGCVDAGLGVYHTFDTMILEDI